METRMFMLVNYTPEDESLGITKKIGGAIQAFRRKKIEVYYTAYNENGVAIIDADDRVILYKKFMFGNRKFGRFTLIKLATRYLLTTDNKFDICFLRFLGFDYSYTKLLSVMKSKLKAHVILDTIGYFDGMKAYDYKTLYMNIMAKFHMKRAMNNVDVVLTEGNEGRIFGMNSVSIKLGVEVSNFNEHCYVGDKEELNLISVANETPYHGYDRLIEALAIYYKNNKKRRVTIHLVGCISEKTKKKIRDLNLEEYVVLYGKKCGKELELIYNSCNMAVGPLAQHRVGNKKDTGLKTKEYFAVGIPYFYTGSEPDVDKDYPYILQVESNDEPIDIDSIWDFYVRIKDDESLCSNMRMFAREHYSWDKITDTMLDSYWRTIG